MKLRIQDSSVRFRITLRELEQLLSCGHLEAEALIPGPDATSTLRYRVTSDRSAPESGVRLAPFALTLVLTDSDLQALADPANEGVYIQREWTDQTGARRRFMAFIEKDRPAAKCEKPEAWIYDALPGQPVSTRPVGAPFR